jgi:sarcosine oxidase subunit beta
MAPGPHVVVIGGGIVGTSAAHHLSGYPEVEVTVYEQGTLGGETTDASMAMIGRSGDPEMARMKSYAMETYNGLMSDPVGEPRFEPTGAVSVATTAEGAATLADRVDGEPADGSNTGDTSGPLVYYEGDAVHTSMVFPTLDTDDVTGVLHKPAKGYATSRELAGEFAHRARDRGAHIKQGVDVEEVRTAGGTAAGVVIDGEAVDADAVVCAAGPWNVSVARTAGVDLPVRHSLAPVMELRPLKPLPRPIPYTIHHETGVYLRDTTHGTVLAGLYDAGTESFEDRDRIDPGAVGETVPDSFRTRIRETIETLFPQLVGAEEVGERLAVGSRTPDAWPVIGWTPTPGFSVAAFHSQGIQLAPAAGDMIARQLIEGDPTDHHGSASISRFDGYDDVRTHLGS